MPKVRIGNAEDLQGLSEKDLVTLMKMCTVERFRRREHLAPKREIDRSLTYVSWEAAKQMLLPYYDMDESRADNAASRLWAALRRMTQNGQLRLDCHCNVCGMVVRKREPGKAVDYHEMGCPSRSGDKTMTLLFSVRSLIDNRADAWVLRSASFPPWVAKNYERIVQVLQ